MTDEEREQILDMWGGSDFPDDPEKQKQYEEWQKEMWQDDIVSSLKSDKLTDDEKMVAWNDAIRSTAEDKNFDEENCIHYNSDGRGPVGIAFYDGNDVLLAPQASVNEAIDAARQGLSDERYNAVVEKLNERLELEQSQTIEQEPEREQEPEQEREPEPEIEETPEPEPQEQAPEFEYEPVAVSRADEIAAIQAQMEAEREMSLAEDRAREEGYDPSIDR